MQELQQFLFDQQLLDTINVTGYFNIPTQVALQKWQASRGIVSSGSPAATGYGVAGEKTRAAIRSCAPAKVAMPLPLPAPTQARVPLPASSASASGQSGPRTLSFGMRGSDVLTLQGQLVTRGLLSADSSTGYFGTLTRAAVRSFQCRTLSICSGSEATNGYGAVGPRTKAALAIATPAANTASTLASTPASQSNASSIESLRAQINDLLAKISTLTGTAPTTVPTSNTQTTTSVTSPTTATTQALTYFWQTGGWSTCTNAAQSRTVSCRSSNDDAVSDSYCIVAKPATSQSCTTTTPSQSCSFNGQTVAHGTSVTAYQTPSVAYGSQCAPQARTCTNGTLSGSYTNVSCSMESAPVQTTIAGPNVSSSNFFGVSAEVSKTGNGKQAALTSSDWYDFLVQDVCTDSNGNAIAGDPYNCGNSRDLRFAEAIPYMHYSRLWDLDGVAYYSWPGQDMNGTPMVIALQDTGHALNAGAAFRDDDLGRGNELFATVEYNGDLISFTGTGGGPDFYTPLWDQGCGHDDMWVEFKKGLAEGQSDSMTSKPAALTTTCPSAASAFGSGFEAWTRGPIVYPTGKVMDTIVTYAFAGPNPGANPGYIETDYWTREYGWTRWEAWSTTGPAHAASNKDCGGAGEQDFYGVHFYRTSCVDTTYVRTFDIPFNPLTYPDGRALMLTKNLLVSGDFQQGTIGNWKQLSGTGQLGTDWAGAKDSATNNSYLKFACWSGCNGNAVYQDVIPASDMGLTGTRTLHFGALLKATQAADAVIQIFLVGTNGAIIASPSISTHATTDWQHFDSAYTHNFSTQPVSYIRYTVYPQKGGVEYSMDEAYLTPSF